MMKRCFEIVFIGVLPTSVRDNVTRRAGLTSPQGKVGAKNAIFVKKCQAKFHANQKKALIFQKKLID